MSRFLSIHWSLHDRDATNRLALLKRRLFGWESVLEVPGLVVFSPAGASNAQDICILDDQLGVVLGTAFPRPEIAVPHPLSKVRRFGPAQAHEIVNTEGRSLVSGFWGSYVAIFISRDRSSSQVLRGPFSRIKCFHATYGGLHLFFAHMDDYADLRLSRLTINWDCVRAQAACADYLGRETAINEISAMEAGECAQVSERGISRRFYWNPCEIAEKDAIASFEDAASALHTATQMCVQSWALHHGRIVHTLSGGLDSSISVSCARKILPRSSVICLNYFSKHALGDERRFARAVADELDIELVEREREENVDLSILQDCTRTAWPILDFSGYGQYRVETQLAREHGASAIFNGELGDNLFEQGAGYQAAADYVWRHGVRPGLLRIAIDSAVRRNLSVWKVLYHACLEGFSRPTSSRWSSHHFVERVLGLRISDLTLLRPTALEDVQRCSGKFVHPWLKRIEKAPPAKFLMIYGFCVANAYDPPFATLNDPPSVAPLGSQPLADICLRIPTYFNNKGATSRAVARHAFRGELPASVLQRTSKGTPEPWTRNVVRRNQAFLRSFLLEGVLVREGILDPKRVESVLSGEIGRSQIVISDLIVQIYIEAWLQSWSTRCSALAA